MPDAECQKRQDSGCCGSLNNPSAHRPDDPRREGHDQDEADEDDDGCGGRVLQRERAEADDERVLDEAQEPVAERLRLVFATARVLALVRCVLAASVPPTSAATALAPGDASPSVATAISAPPAGLITVCTVSHSESSHGILSAKNSTM